MRSARSALGSAIAAMLLVAHPAPAQETPPAALPEYGSTGLSAELGARVGYDWGLGAWSVGGQLRVPVIPGFALIPSADVFLRAPAPQWQVNLDAAFRLGLYGGLFGGAGLGITRRELGTVQTRTGLDVFVGFAPPRPPHRTVWPFVQARWLLVENRSPFAVVAGLDVEL